MEEDLWNSQVPLSNDQFRQLLETPLHKRKATFAERRGLKGKVQKAVPVKEEQHGSPLALEPVTSELQYEIPSDKPLYRDRARERREGKNVDYASLSGLEGQTNVSDGAFDARVVSVEDSKFLGGDMEHTHLVKGLDYALLNKERARIQKTEAESIKKEQLKQEQKRSKV